MITCNWLMTKF